MWTVCPLRRSQGGCGFQTFVMWTRLGEFYQQENSARGILCFISHLKPPRDGKLWVRTRQGRKREKMQGAWKEKGALVPGSQLHFSLAESQKYQHNRQITEDSLQGQSLSLRKMSNKTFIRSRTCLRPECVQAMISLHQSSCPTCKPNQALYKAPHNV